MPLSALSPPIQRTTRYFFRSAPVDIEAPGRADPKAYWYSIVWGTETSNTSTDRKSTRLNSSHVAISYAVFCLKKKIPQATKATNVSIVTNCRCHVQLRTLCVV